MSKRKQEGYMGMSENGVYPQKKGHLVGIMISKTIGCRATLFSGTHSSSCVLHGTLQCLNLTDFTGQQGLGLCRIGLIQIW